MLHILKIGVNYCRGCHVIDKPSYQEDFVLIYNNHEKPATNPYILNMRRIILTLWIVNAQLYVGAFDMNSFIGRADAFMKKYVEGGQVAYSNVKQNLSEAENLYKEIGMTNLSASTQAEKKAFYINAYNIIVIYSIAKHFPVNSPMDVKGFFDTIKHTVAGEKLTLNELEGKKLLQPFKDGRLHFVLVCAAKSCPPLANYAYTPVKVEEQLTERTVLTLNNKDWIKVYPKQKKAALSKIFEWYKDDFKPDGKTVLAWINQFRNEKIPSSYSLTFYDYDWSLNDKK
jgi:hypothetical protein